MENKNKQEYGKQVLLTNDKKVDSSVMITWQTPAATERNKKKTFFRDLIYICVLQNVTRRQNISQLCWCNSTQLPYSTVSYFRDFAILFVMTNQSQKYEEEKTAAKFAGAAP